LALSPPPSAPYFPPKEVSFSEENRLGVTWNACTLYEKIRLIEGVTESKKFSQLLGDISFGSVTGKRNNGDALRRFNGQLKAQKRHRMKNNKITDFGEIIYATLSRCRYYSL
jgi:hypothetical protein